MTNYSASNAPVPVPTLVADSLTALHAMHAEEVTRLRNTIDELLLQVRRLDAEKQQLLQTLAIQGPRLREANENLVLATFGAQDLQARAEHANQQQSDFMAMLAHELRNPLQPVAVANSLIGLLGDAHPDLPRLHGVIQRQVAQMARLVDDLLDAGRIRAGKLRVDPYCITLSEILNSALEATMPLLDQRGQSVAMTLPASPVAMMGDIVRLTQVFTNLLVNASKFTQDGGAIHISAVLRGAMVDIQVADNGIGITPALQTHIFDLFAQGELMPAPARGGLGIGLALVRAIAEIHGGTVSVHSGGPGQGSTFTVSLPALVGHAAQ